MRPAGIRRLFRLRARSARDTAREVDEEIRLHVELRTAELVREGLDPARAEAEARRRFARDGRAVSTLYETALERDREMRTRERLESLLLDVRYALRGLVGDRALTTFVVLTLALGIGANVTAWSLVDRLLVRDPAHVVAADRVVRLYSEVDMGDVGPRRSSWIPYSAYLQFRGLDAFEAVGAYVIRDGLVGRGVGARRMRVGQTLGAFFPLLGVRAVEGRFFSGDDDGAADGPLAILSNELWRTRYAGSADGVGGDIVVDDVTHTIVGVAPAGFSGTEPRRVDVWVLGDSRTAGTRNWTVIGRLRAGATPEGAAAEATNVHVPDGSGPFAWFRDVRMFTAPLAWGDDGREPIEATLARWLAGVTTIILLITFANVVNLLLVRVVRRRRELAIRVSLGAGRLRVVRLIALEGALLAVGAGLVSLLFARLLEPLVRRALLGDQAAWTFSVADGRVLLVVGVTVLLTMISVGTVPALQAGGRDVARALRSGVRAGASSFRLRGALTAVQAALSVLLLVGAGLFLRSFANVRGLDLGVDLAQVLIVEPTLPPFRSLERGTYESGAHMERAVFRRLEDAVRRVPGVERAGVAIGLPLDGGSFSATVHVPGRDSIPSLPGGGPWVSIVSPGYFAAVGTAIVDGRAFSAADREGSEPVAIVNATMAAALWPAGNALGACMRIDGPAGPCIRIVGIAGDVHRVGLRERPSFQYYLPLGQLSMFGGARLVVRPAPGATVSPDALRQVIVETEPLVRAVEVARLDDALDGEMRPLRIGMVTFGLSGALALAVAVLGLYSMMAYMVAWRTHEIGVRVALGATRSNVARLVLRSALRLAAIGIATGITLAAIAGRWLQPHLFETSARDATVSAVVALALLLTAALAGWLPARRATRISPTEALRAE